MKLKDYEPTIDYRSGFVVIEDLENAQQVTVDAKKLAVMLRIVQQLEKLGFDKITITVENNNPIVIGGRRIGIALVPTLEEKW